MRRFKSSKTRLHYASEEIAGEECLMLQPVSFCVGDSEPYAKKQTFFQSLQKQIMMRDSFQQGFRAMQ